MKISVFHRHGSNYRIDTCKKLNSIYSGRHIHEMLVVLRYRCEMARSEVWYRILTVPYHTTKCSFQTRDARKRYYSGDLFAGRSLQGHGVINCGSHRSLRIVQFECESSVLVLLPADSNEVLLDGVFLGFFHDEPLDDSSIWIGDFYRLSRESEGVLWGSSWGEALVPAQIEYLYLFYLIHLVMDVIMKRK